MTAELVLQDLGDNHLFGGASAQKDTFEGNRAGLRVSLTRF